MAGLVYISKGLLHLRAADGQEKTIESQFGRSLRDRAAQIENRHAWKTQGRGANFMRGVIWGQGPCEQDRAEFPIRITGVTRAGADGDLLYSLETNEVGGIFAIDAQGVEQRLFHTADFRVRHLSASPDGNEVAATITHDHFMTHIGVLGRHGGGLQEVTEGDSVDAAPRWVPGERRQLVYQSAGVGRDAGGRPAGLGSITICRLDLDSGQVETLAEDERYDFLAPQARADGSLLFIRKPRATTRDTKANAWSSLKDAALFPFRLTWAIVQFFNFFSMRYSGKPLVSPQGGVSRPIDPLHLMMASNLAAAMDAGPDDDRPLVPDSWELMERSAAGQLRTLAKGVLSYDSTPGGQLLYADGSAIFEIDPGGVKQRLIKAPGIEHVAAL